MVVVVVVGRGSGTDDDEVDVDVVLVVASVTTATSPERPRKNPIVAAANNTRTTAAPMLTFFIVDGCMTRGYRAPRHRSVALGAAPRGPDNVPTNDRTAT